MKGIRKLFFGLILMTLIGVGFKVEAKAAELYVNKTSDKVQLLFNTTSRPSGDDPDIYIINTSVSGPATVTSSDNIQIEVYKDGTTSEELPYTLWEMEMDDALAAFRNDEHGGIIDAYAWGTKNGKNLRGAECTINGCKITPTVVFNEGDPSSVVITPAKDTPVYLLDGDELSFSVTTDAPKIYNFDGWFLSGTKISSEKSGTLSVTSRMSGDYDLEATYSKRSGTLTFPKNDLNGAILSPGNLTTIRDFELGSSLTGADISKVIIGDKEVIPSVTGKSASKGTLRFTVPDTLTADVNPYDVKIVMEDGTSVLYSGKVYVIDRDTLDVTLSPSGPVEIEVDETQTFSVTTNVPVGGTVTLNIPSSTSNNYIENVTNKTSLAIKGKAVTSTAQEVSASVEYAIEGLGRVTTKSTASVADVTVVAPTLKLKDPVVANVGLKVPLSYYTGSGGININGIASSYITASGTKGLAETITLEGKSATTLKEDAITVTDSDGNSVTSDVIVYPKPTISADRSGTGSNTKYTFKISAPTAVYDGKSAYTDVDSAVLQFKGSKDTYEYSDSISLKADGTSTIKQVNSDTISIDIKKLREIFDKICEDDKEEVKVTVAPKENTSYKSDAYTLKVYKIKLDGSAGADYKVMGESVSDSFYAIDGVSYEIAASPKSGYSGTPTKWDGTSFGTSASGSTSFSESKTVKAYYDGGTSSLPNSSTPGRNSGAAGEGMDDYDDVPKTGESKTDIWILWSVLFVSILGAGFMIWKRFGLVRAIAEADEEVAVAEHKEEVKAKKKEKEDKLKMLKDLRNL